MAPVVTFLLLDSLRSGLISGSRAVWLQGGTTPNCACVCLHGTSGGPFPPLHSRGKPGSISGHSPPRPRQLVGAWRFGLVVRARSSRTGCGPPPRPHPGAGPAASVLWGLTGHHAGVEVNKHLTSASALPASQVFFRLCHCELP